MAESKVGFILGLIGGIIGVIIGLIWTFGAGAITAILTTIGLGWLGGFGIGLGIWYIVSGALVIWFSTWMKDPKKCRAGGIWVLILSIIGAGTILGLIGGIIGIVQGGK